MSILIGFGVLSVAIYAVILYLFKYRLTGASEKILGIPKINQPVSQLELYLFLFTVILAVILRIKWMGRSLVFDEIHNVLYSINVNSIWTVISSSYGFSNHIGNSLAAYFAKNLFGTADWVFRLPSLSLGLLSIFYMWHFGRRYFGPKTTMIALLAVACSPTHVNWSVSARGYAGMLFFGLILIFQFLELLQKPSKSTVAVYIIAAVLGIYFHVYTTLVIASQAVFLFFLVVRKLRSPQKPNISPKTFFVIWLAFGLSAFFSILIYLPVMKQMIDSLNLYGQVKIFREGFPLDLLQALAGSPTFVSLLAGSVFAIGLFTFYKARSIEFYYYVCLFLFPTMIVWLSRPYYLYPRFFYYLLPVFLLFIVTGVIFILKKIEILRFKQLFRAGVALVVLLIFVNWIAQSWNKIHKGRIEGVADIMKEYAGPGTGFCAIGIGSNLFEYYIKQTIVPKNIDEFNEIASRYTQIICAYDRRPGVESPQHSEIGHYLEENSTLLYDDHFKIFLLGSSQQ
ncbi:glycosyltransferase family 39 protein [candidate division KSB1 bacterium]|nr:glycosyltransferase family 39 protein [candidate division KSB1 bacterium]